MIKINQSIGAFLNKLLDTAGRHKMFEPGRGVLVALSGGADSVALAAALLELSSRLGIEVSAAHLNHCLRDAESDRDEQYVRDFCAKYDIPLVVESYNIKELALEKRMGIEEAARLVRYNFLEGSAERLGCGSIATAHNANDNAETMIFNLARGTGLRGLCGIPPVRGNIVRPLIDITRSEIEHYLNLRGIPYVTDSTNADSTYTRNRIRHSVLPVLLDINPSFVEKARDTAALLTDDADTLDAIATGVLATMAQPKTEPSPTSVLLSVDKLLELTPSLSGRIVIEANRSIGGAELSKRHIEAVLALARGENPSASLNLPSYVVAKRKYSDIILERSEKHADPHVSQNTQPRNLSLGENNFGTWVIKLELVGDKGSIETQPHGAAIVTPRLLEFGLSIRQREPSDTIAPKGRGWGKSLKKLFIDMKIPREERDRIPVVTYKGQVVAVPNLAPDKKFAVNSSPAIKITFENQKNGEYGYAKRK